MKYNYFFIICTFVVFSFFVATKKSRQKTESETFTVGTAAGYAPWVSINENGDYEGFDIDIMNILAQTMNKKLVIKDLGSMPSLFIALEQGTIDAIIWGMSVTQDRLKKVSMIRYQGETTTSYPLIFWKQIPNQFKTTNDLNNITICVEPSSAQEAVLDRYPSVKKILTDKVDDALLAIQYKKANAALVEPAIAKKFKAKYPEIQSIDIPLSSQDIVFGVGICIKKENTLLTNNIQKAVEKIQETGIISSFEKKWGIV